MSQYQPYQPGEISGQNFEHQQLQPYSQHSAPMPYSAPAPHPAMPQPVQQVIYMPPAMKEIGVAYALAILLGQFGAHRFYLGRPGSAICQLLLWFGGWLTVVLGVGAIMLLIFFIWWVVDLCTLPVMTRNVNELRMRDFAARTGQQVQYYRPY
ncbi:TM2 domain-containing protein [Agrococcus casei]|uniref:TM2 domain-containing protein n=1 Tax=Agrococcus casei TaxID=343512 RepID=UPI003F922367